MVETPAAFGNLQHKTLAMYVVEKEAIFGVYK